MFRAIIVLSVLLLAEPALAFSPSINVLNPQVVPVNRVFGIPAIDDNLAAKGYPIAGGFCAEWGHKAPCNNHYSIVRASTKYVSASDGLYTSVPAGVFGLGSNNGGSIEEARTNDALWARDMTNAAWVKTTMTTALNAVGIDGSANSATTLTATGSSAMAVQTITLASQADNYSVFLKRVTGSGTINLCLAATACGTVTACTVTSTTTFTRCTVTATVLNPIVGIQIVTNGDAVIADFNQMEPGRFPTTPMLTTSAPVSRSADNVKESGQLLAVSMTTTGSVLLAINNGVAAAAQGGVQLLNGTGGTNLNINSNSSDVLQASPPFIFLSGASNFVNPVTVTFGWTLSTGNTLCATGLACANGSGTSTAPTAVYVNSNGGITTFIDAYTNKISEWPVQLSNTLLKALAP